MGSKAAIATTAITTRIGKRLNNRVTMSPSSLGIFDRALTPYTAETDSTSIQKALIQQTLPARKAIYAACAPCYPHEFNKIIVETFGYGYFDRP